MPKWLQYYIGEEGSLGTPKSDYVICARPLIKKLWKQFNLLMGSGFLNLDYSSFIKYRGPGPFSLLMGYRGSFFAHPLKLKFFIQECLSVSLSFGRLWTKCCISSQPPCLIPLNKNMMKAFISGPSCPIFMIMFEFSLLVLFDNAVQWTFVWKVFHQIFRHFSEGYIIMQGTSETIDKVEVNIILMTSSPPP